MKTYQIRKGEKMKKIHVILIALALAVAMLSLIAVPALAKAQKVDLEKAVGAPGGGFVVFNGPAGNN
jgi:Spy/CpxP family protein refolding chaperone